MKASKKALFFLGKFPPEDIRPISKIYEITSKIEFRDKKTGISYK